MDRGKSVKDTGFKHKYEHLLRFRCNPTSEVEFAAIKMAAKLGGVMWWGGSTYKDGQENFTRYERSFGVVTTNACRDTRLKEIPVLDFIKKLRISEEDAKELEDNKLIITDHSVTRTDGKAVYVNMGYQWCVDGNPIKGMEISITKKM